MCTLKVQKFLRFDKNKGSRMLDAKYTLACFQTIVMFIKVRVRLKRAKSNATKQHIK